MTNGDYIRSMSDEELARMMRRIDPEDIGIPFCNSICPHREKDCGADDKECEMGCNYFRDESYEDGNERVWFFYLQKERD